MNDQLKNLEKKLAERKTERAQVRREIEALEKKNAEKEGKGVCPHCQAPLKFASKGRCGICKRKIDKNILVPKNKAKKKLDQKADNKEVLGKYTTDELGAVVAILEGKHANKAKPKKETPREEVFARKIEEAKNIEDYFQALNSIPFVDTSSGEKVATVDMISGIKDLYEKIETNTYPYKRPDLEALLAKARITRLHGVRNKALDLIMEKQEAFSREQAIKKLWGEYEKEEKLKQETQNSGIEQVLPETEKDDLEALENILAECRQALDNIDKKTAKLLERLKQLEEGN